MKLYDICQGPAALVQIHHTESKDTISMPLHAGVHRPALTHFTFIGCCYYLVTFEALS